jgi:hypothetical protein
MEAPSISRYGIAEFRLVWTLLEYEARRSSTKTDVGSTPPSPSPPLFILNDTLIKSLQNLRNLLSSSRKSERQIEGALRVVFDKLYFPDEEERNSAYQKPVHVFPILQFIIFCFITSDGAYQPIHRLPPILAWHQYCIRLRGLHRINKEIEAKNKEGWRKLGII